MKTAKYIVGVALGIASTIFCLPLFGQTQISAVKQIPYADTLQGVIIQDNYHWMQNLNDPAVRKFIRQKNKEAQSVWKKMRPIEKEFYSVANSRYVSNAPNDTLFTKWSGSFTYFEKERGKSTQYIKKDRKGNETILFDSKNVFPTKSYKNYGILYIIPSPNEKYVYSSAGRRLTDNSLRYHWVGRISQSGVDNSFVEHLEGAFNGLWLNDSSLVYTKYEKGPLTNKVYMHILGHRQGEDRLLYEEFRDSHSWVEIVKSSSGRYVFVKACDCMFDEYYYIDADGQLKLIVKRSPEHRPIVDHFGNDTVFYIMTNLDAPNGEVLAVSINNPNVQKLVVPESKRRLCGLHNIGNYLVVP